MIIVPWHAGGGENQRKLGEGGGERAGFVRCFALWWEVVNGQWRQ